MTTNRDLLGRKLVVTGAARGIGESVARRAAAHGARIALIGLEPDRLRSLANELGPSVRWFEADVRDTGALKSAIDASAVAMNGIDMIVANAGVAAYGTVRQVGESSFERVVDTNLNGVFRTLKHATPHLERSRGHALIVASALSFTTIGGMASYAASKAGVEALGLAYRAEVAHLGITVGIVHPSWIDTDLVRGAEVDIPSFRAMRGKLPYPGNVTTSVDRAADAIVAGLANRRPRVYVPRAVAIANWAKAFLNSPLVWPWTRRFAAATVPLIETEVAALGRNDQLVPRKAG